MFDCERCQALVLEHLYGLLEPDEARAFEAHVAGCPDCTAAADRARSWQQRLAQAAKAEFPGVTFTPPGEVTEVVEAPPPAPAALRAAPAPAAAADGRPSMGRVWRRWALAAGLLLAVGAAGFPAGRHLLAYRHYRAEADRLLARADALRAEQQELTRRHGEQVGAALREFNAAQARLAETRRQWEQELNEAAQVIANKSLYVRVTGPERAQPGAANEYEIRTFDRNHRDTTAKLDIVVRDDAGKELLRKSSVNSPVPVTLRLPESVWKEVEPDAELFLEVVAHDQAGGKSTIAEKIPLAPPVYVAHLVTDKPMYRPGETVYYRALTLERSTFRPPAEPMELTFQITGPSGEQVFAESGTDSLRKQDGSPVTGPDGKPLRGVASGAFTIPDGLPGGEYTLRASRISRRLDAQTHTYAQQAEELARRKFLINVYRPDVLQKKLEFDGKSYGGGDVVMARCEARRAEGVLAGAPVTVKATVDGEEIKVQAPSSTDAEGVVRVRFELPEKIERGDGTLAVTFHAGDVNETIVRPIPLVTNNLLVDFYPEGGELVEGVPGRVYFQVRTPTGKPADLAGVVTDGADVVAEARTLTDPDHPGVNRGLGVFSFTPQAGRKYELKVQKPAGVTKTFPLPAARPDGVVLTIPDGVTGPGEPIRARVQTGKTERTLLVGGYTRGRLFDHRRVTVKPGAAQEVVLTPRSEAGGVVRVTVFEEAGEEQVGRLPVTPVAERLVFRRPEKKLQLAVRPDKSRYAPGERAELTLTATGEKGDPVPAVLLVAVVNQSVITMADDKTERMLPAHLLLASEVKDPEDLEHADFLVGPHPKAEQTLDLLLGTQGWRRFAEVKPEEFRRREAGAADRLLAAIGAKSSAPRETLLQEREKVDQRFAPKLRELAEKVAEAQAALAEAQRDDAYTREHAALAAQLAGVEKQVQEARHDLEVLRRQRREVLGWLLPGLFLTVLAVGFVALIAGLARRDDRTPVRAYVTAGVSFAACGVALLVFALTQRNGMETPDARALAQSPPGERAMKFADKAEVGAAAELRVLREAAGEEPPVPLDAAAPEGPAPAGGVRARGAWGEPKMMPSPPPPGGAPGQPGPAAPAIRFVPPPPPEPARNRPEDVREARKLARPTAARVEAEPGRAGREVGEMEKMPEFRQLQNREPRRRMAQGQPGPVPAQQDAVGDLKDAPVAPGGFPGAGIGGGFGAARGRDFAGSGIGGFGGGELGGGAFNLEGGFGGVIPRQEPFFVREYAHFRPETMEDLRNDFTETVLWQPALVLPESGQAKVSFSLASDVTRYRVLVCGHTLDGRIGALQTHIEARKPFSLNPKLPLEVTAGDKIDVPLALVNDSDQPRAVTWRLQPEGLRLDSSAAHAPALRTQEGTWADQAQLAAEEKARRVYRFVPSIIEGRASLRVRGQSDPPAPADEIERALTVVPEGFPAGGAHSDLLEKVANVPVELPEAWVPGTLKVRLDVYPSTLAELQKGLDGLLREPNGCFEQTSTTNYPNVLILDYLQASDQANPEVSKRAKELIDRGYQKLTSFECLKPAGDGRQGYEWFGGTAPPHEALTAYGLLQFRDMSRVYPVDAEMLRRTQQYLLGQRDGKGGFKRNPRALDSFGGAPPEITDAYIVWALTESDPGNEQGLDLTAELNALKERAKTSEDPYLLALAANSLLNRGQNAAAVEILRRAAGMQAEDGHVAGARTSITRSGGQSLQIETTALAVLGWLKANRPDLFNAPLQAAVKWVGRQRGGHGAFGSTQSTILALKALIAYTEANRRPAESGELRLYAGEQLLGKKSFTPEDRADAITVEVAEPEKLLKPGANELRVEITAKHPYPFTLAWECMTLKPRSAEQSAVKLETKLDRTEAAEGETVRLSVRLENTTAEGHGMAVAIIGLPAGLKLPEDMKQLKKLTELPVDGSAPRLGYFELRGTRELILYWRSLAPKQVIELSLDLICEVPGEYRGPASRGYLYYNPDHKHWVDPLAVKIAAKE